jgi:hypothetical protein
MFTDLPKGIIKKWKFKVERDANVIRIKGVGYNGMKVIGKFAPKSTDACGSERRIVTLLKASGSREINKLMDLYVFAGVVPYSKIKTMLGKPDAVDYAADTPMDVVITNFKHKCTVHDHFIYLGKKCTNEAELSLMIATVLKAVFEMLVVLRDRAQCVHQDMKLDNLIILPVEDVITIYPIDFELAALASGTGLGLDAGNPAADIKGWGGSHLYKHTTQYFDIHTVIAYTAVYCGDAVSKCSAVQTLWTSFLNKSEIPSRGVNKSGFCNVYLTEPPKYNPLKPSITFETAIAACEQLIVELDH